MEMVKLKNGEKLVTIKSVVIVKSCYLPTVCINSTKLEF